MSIPYVTDGETDLDSALFNPIISRINITNDYSNVVDIDSNGVDDVTDELQAYIDDRVSSGGPVSLRPGTNYRVRTLTLKPNVSLEGANPERGGTSARLLGTAGYNIIELGESSNPSGMAVRNLQLLEGLNGIASLWGANFIEIEGIQASNFSNSCLYFAQSVERWTVRRCWFTQSKYGVQFENVQPNFVQQSVIDKMLFESISCTSNESGWHFDIGFTGNSNTWLNCINTVSYKHGMYLSGYLQDSVFINCNNEAVGWPGVPYPLNQTTGTISSASDSLVVADAADWNDDEDICIAGAGANGTDLQTTVVSRVGTTFTLADTASRSVTSAKVTNAIYDDLHMAHNGTGNPQRNTFIGGHFGYSVAESPCRYGIRSTGRNTFIASAFAEPCYSPDGLDSFINCRGSVRQPPAINGWHVDPGSIQLIEGGSAEGERTLIASGRNKPLQLWLADSVGNGSGTRDWFEVRMQDPNRTLAFGIDGTTYDTVLPGGGYDNGHLRLGGYHLWVDSTGDLRIKSSAPSSDTDGSVVGGQS